jgi:hypothetical protein
MRKVIGLLDDEQCRTMLWFADFGTAVFSSALVVTLLKTLLGSPALA